MLKPRSIKGRDFLEFLEELRAKVKGHCYLLLDNASIHKTKYVKDYISANAMELAFIPPYCPEF